MPNSRHLHLPMMSWAAANGDAEFACPGKLLASDPASPLFRTLGMPMYGPARNDRVWHNAVPPAQGILRDQLVWATASRCKLWMDRERCVLLAE